MRQHAPRTTTMLLAAILLLVGFAGTFLNLLPSTAGYPGTTIGVVAYVAATVVMLVGIFVRGL
jgi:hypothetical protein